MIRYKNINKEFVAPVELQTLQNSFNTLEKGHQEAVKAESQLKLAISQLEMNEQEDEFKANLVNEIETTIANNTIFGNKYGALDEITARLGNIMIDPKVKGRVEAQKNYKEFRNRVINDKTLTQRDKDYFLANNPYYYTDKYDNKGNVIGGTVWNPIESPTTKVPLSDLVVKGISIAAKESGGGTVTRWLDENGKITTDPNKAYDGEYFNTTTNTWTRLGRDKIMAGIKAMIETTPGAKESLEQDYKVAKWHHEQQLKQNNNKPFASDITDSNGIYLSEEQYLLKRVAPAVQAAEYYNSTNQTTYGKGLATYKAAQAKAATNNLEQQLKMSSAAMSGANTPVEIAAEQASSFLFVKNTSRNKIKDTYKKLTGKDLVIDGDNDIDLKGLESLLNKYNISTNDRQLLRNYAKIHNEAVQNLNNYTKDMTENDKKEFMFANRMLSGGEIISSENGGSKYDDQLIERINKIYGKDGETLEIVLGDKMLTNVKNILNANEYNGAKKLGVQIQNGKLIIPKSAMNSLPMISSIINTAEARSNKGFLPTIYQMYTWGTGRYYTYVIDKNGNKIQNQNTITHSDNPYIQLNLYNIGDIYNKAKDINNKLYNKYDINPTNVELSSLNLDGQHFTDGTLLDQLNKGFISTEEYNKNKKYFDDSFDNIIRGIDFSQTEMYRAEDGGVRTKVVDSSDRYNYGTEILQAIRDKRATFSPTIVPGSYDPLSGAPVAGYNITVIPKVDKDGVPLNEGKTISYYIPKMINETASEIMMKDPYIRAFTSISTLGATKSTTNLIESTYNPAIGDVSISGLGANNFQVNYNGLSQIVNLQEAIKLTTAFNNYNACKDAFLSSETNEINPRLRSTLVAAAIDIADTFGIDAEGVLERFIEDINK